jgi:hypothetical protein
MFDFNVLLVAFVAQHAVENHQFSALDVADATAPQEKSAALTKRQVTSLRQIELLQNQHCRISLEPLGDKGLLSMLATSHLGICTGDYPRFGRLFWELRFLGDGWTPEHSTVDESLAYGGMSNVLLWEDGRGQFRRFLEQRLGVDGTSSWLRGTDAWGKQGVIVTAMGKLPASIYCGDLFDNNVTVIVPKNERDLLAIWAFCESRDFHDAVRRVNRSLKITDQSMVEISFDLVHWQRVAAEKYPNGLPKPDSNDPTQWLFNGSLMDSSTPLQVGVARLLGYRWPRQNGQTVSGASPVPDDGLETFVDEDGIVCIPSVRGESPAAERLRALLAAAYSKAWSPGKLDELLSAVDYAGSNLEDWLRNGIFDQHSKLFHHRPFVWQIWDGRKDGFSALVNYHKLDHKLLEKLTYTYLGDWIKKQQEAVGNEESGADDRLLKAQQLQDKLKLILEGEAPYDIFVRWKPLEQQPIGWHPDLNDGVRLNIRPFMEADVLRKRPNIKWGKDRGKNPSGSPWGEERDNDRHLTLEEKRKAKNT